MYELLSFDELYESVELDELYGIETKANAMAAMINAYKEKNEELKEALAKLPKVPENL